MSIPSDYIAGLLDSLSQSRIDNLVTQADARRILQEVRESNENYPNFDPSLTEKATHIAYALLSCGCSLIENGDSDTTEGLAILEKAGKILSDAYKYNNDEPETRDYHLLIAGMALYAAKQYSRAFIVLNDVNIDFAVGQMVVQFVKKNFESLMQTASSLFFEQALEPLDIQDYNAWIISHEIARCFLIITDFIHTGNQDDFVLAFELLEKLSVLASESRLTLHWLIVRLSKIIFSTFQSASLWTVLPPLIPATYITEKYIRLLGGFKSPVTEMWPSQTASLPLAIGENRGAVINLRTSGGKTRVAEIAILKTLSTHTMSKVLYLAPFRSLAFEIEQSLNKTFGPLDITVSQLYGGSTANVTDFELISQSQVIIATPEKAKALIRCGSGLETEIKLIVVDEGHLLGAEERHIKNEMFLTHIKEFASRNEIRMLLLSAVLPNAGDLAQWIADDPDSVAKSEWKPSLERLGLLLWNGDRVRLEWKSSGEPFNPNFIQKRPLGFGRRRNPFPNNKKEAVAATAVRLAEAGTVMIYSARANSIEGLAESVLLALGEHPENYSWNESLWNVFESVCIEELREDDIVLRAARKGIICHNNRLPALVRIAIERLMRSKPPLIIIASSTLGQGVNVGISTVIVFTPYYSQESISNRDFWNICGRAGRAFSDVEGKILYAIDTQASTNRDRWRVRNDMSLARDYFNSQQMENVRSGLLVALKAIYRAARRTSTDFEMLIEAVANDFIDADIRSDLVEWMNGLFDYLDDELLAMHEDFGEDDADASWIDDVFRKSLALIQAEPEEGEHCISLLHARTVALLNRVPSNADRKRLIASGVPFSLSQSILQNTDHFRTLALSYIQDNNGTDVSIETIDIIVREIEIWSNENAQSIINSVPEQPLLDTIRSPWISGFSLSSIRELDDGVDGIAKDYYGFTLPWIIHAISQMFNKETEENILQAYASIAMFVELGLPNPAATNIYMAGVRSRSAALELSTFEIFREKNVSETKRILLEFPLEDYEVSDGAQVWIELLSNTAKAQYPRRITFPVFTWDRYDLPDRLYIREACDECFLVSSDGFFYEITESTEELPFSGIANINGLYLAREGNKWHLKSYNPLIVIKQ
ncbi:MAG: DEAD/DEAH box helicase [Christensenellaceae bacterium]|jgi:hypothetical protein|nr:DEAD/DEAH box helicase [Christensenellaceae bacterium]